MPAGGTLRAVLSLLVAEADRPTRWRLFAALVVVGASGVVLALAPLALKALIDRLAGTQGEGTRSFALLDHHVLLLALVYVGALCLGRLLSDFRPLLVAAAEQRLHARLSRRLFGHVLGLPASFHLDRQTGALAHSLTQATTATQVILSALMQALPLAIELGTVVLVLAHLGQPQLVAIFLISGVAYAVIYRGGTLRIRRRGKVVAQGSLAAQAFLADSMLNVETIKCFSAEGVVRQRFIALTEALQSGWVDLHRQRAGLAAASTAVFAVAVTASFVVSLEAVANGTLSVGGFVLTTVYILQMVRPLDTLGGAVRDIGQAIEFIEPARRILDEQVEHAHQRDSAGTQGSKLPSRPLDIRLSGVHFSYAQGTTVLCGLDLHIPAGGTMAIVGPSGSGKSSIARLLLGLIQPTAGQILFGERPLHETCLGDIRAAIGYVPQDVVLFDDTIANNVAIGMPQASQAEVEQACRLAKVHDLIRAQPDGYNTRVGERGLKLSGGERQRIAIARALLRRPSMFLFDEPTSALDSRTEAEVVHDLRRICAGRTTIMITHRLTVARHADRIALLQDGHAVEVGTHQELLLHNGTYARLHRLQAGAEGTAANDGDAGTAT